MDSFVEQLVKKKRKGTDRAKTVMIILLTILVPVGCGALAYVITAYLIYVAFFLLLVMIYVCWYYITSQSLEYEYAVTNNNITVDKIIAKRRRKRVLSIDISEFNAFGKISDESFANKKFAKYYLAAEDIDDENTYAAVFTSTARGTCVLLFTPNDKVIEAMRPYFSREIAKKLYLEKRSNTNG